MSIFSGIEAAGIESIKPALALLSVIWIVLLVSTSIALLLANKVTKPIRHVVHYANLLARGDRKTLLEDTPKERELMILVQSMVDLRDRLVNYESELRKKSALAAMGSLSTQVAHDIRSPLSSMQAALMMLRKHCGSDKSANEFLNLLQLSGNRLENIANGLLAKYKGEESVVQTFSIHEVLDELMGELQASPLGQGTEFKKQYSDTALYVSGDKTGINRAVGNIIKNALEAMQQNPKDRRKQLTVSTACHPERSELLIHITDTGPGISADRIALILIGGHTEGKEDGHGIGTKVVREVVEAHNGHLDVESEMGVGSTFIITLPAVLCHEEMTVTIPLAEGGNVYVIDDEPSLREQWRLTLKAQGVSAKIFSCWEEFDSVRGESIEPRQPSTFIIDCHFDNSLVDGLEIIRRLKAQGHTQFILATAEYWKPDIKEAAKSLGATLCPKPLPQVVVSKDVIENPAGVTQSSEIAAAPSEPRNDSRGRTVLLIDDDDAIRLTWTVIKTQLGVATLHCFPSLEAVIQAKVNLGTCDLCIIDKNIPGSDYDGARMLDYLKQNGAKKVILATGEQERDIRKDPQFDALDGITADKIPTSLEEYWN